MALDVLIRFGLQLSIFLTVFAIGLGARPADAINLLRRPRQLARSMLAMNVILPIVMAIIVATNDLPSAIAVALLALTVSPAPPLLLKKQIGANGDPSYAIGLLTIAASTAVFFSPLAVQLLGRFFVTPVHMPAWPIAKVALVSTASPLAAGMLLRKLAPAFAARRSKSIALSGDVLLAVCAAPVLITMWPEVRALLCGGGVVATASFVIVGLALGHWFGGPASGDRTVLALATAKRHPGVAMAIAATNFPDKAILPAIALYTVLSALIVLPYILWRKRQASFFAGTA